MGQRSPKEVCLLKEIREDLIGCSESLWWRATAGKDIQMLGQVVVSGHVQTFNSLECEGTLPGFLVRHVIQQVWRQIIFIYEEILRHGADFKKGKMLWFNGASFQELDHDGQGGAIDCLGREANGSVLIISPKETVTFQKIGDPLY